MGVLVTFYEISKRLTKCGEKPVWILDDKQGLEGHSTGRLEAQADNFMDDQVCMRIEGRGVHDRDCDRRPWILIFNVAALSESLCGDRYWLITLIIKINIGA